MATEIKPIQAMMDGLSAGWQKERGETQLTLGELISILEAMPKWSKAPNLTRPHSYRGYYCDLAFEGGAGVRPTSDLLADCKGAMGKVFEGYKGGDYVMGESTPVWIAYYGSCGSKLMAVFPNGEIETEEED